MFGKGTVKKRHQPSVMPDENFDKDKRCSSRWKDIGIENGTEANKSADRVDERFLTIDRMFSDMKVKLDEIKGLSSK